MLISREFSGSRHKQGLEVFANLIYRPKAFREKSTPGYRDRTRIPLQIPDIDGMVMHSEPQINII